MTHNNEPICALATPPGTAGLAVIRLSGEQCFSIADKCFHGKLTLSEVHSHTVHYGTILYNNTVIDTVTATVFRTPHSYTGEDTVEFGCHGSMIVVEQILQCLHSNGARPAEAGEFTRRAFLNGKIDLTQVEAVADIIHSSSVIGAQTAARQLMGGFTKKLAFLRDELIRLCGLLELELDFTEQDIEFVDRTILANTIREISGLCTELANGFRSAQVLRSGFFIGLVGFPNAGKSSLFNALLERRRAIVSDTPGTTRDFIEESLFIDGIAVKLFDTAGIRTTDDAIEMEGIVLAESVIQQSNLILVLNDCSIDMHHSDQLLNSLEERFPHTQFVLVQNKIDKCPEKIINSSLAISAKTGEGIQELKQYVSECIKPNTQGAQDVLINARHALLLQQAVPYLHSAENALAIGLSNDLIAIDVRAAVRILGEITGQVTGDDILNAIFGSFCIGK